MSRLRAMCEGSDSDLEETTILELIETRLERYAGARIEVFVRSAAEMAAPRDSNPCPDEPGNHVTVHFLDRKPPDDLVAAARGLDGERFVAADREVFVLYPDGMGGSRLRFDLGRPLSAT